MDINTSKAKKNIEHAQRWLIRARKDFILFKKLVPFDKRTNKPVRCTDPALAVYLLQQSVEKAVKAAAIASGQYKVKDFINYYKHNSLALIINLYNKTVAKIGTMGLGSMINMMGVDLSEGEAKLSGLESQIMGNTPLVDKEGKEVDFSSESISVTPEAMDQILDMLDRNRNMLLDVIRTTFNLLPDLGIHKGQEVIDEPRAFLRQLSDLVTTKLKIRSLSEEQLEAAIEFTKHMIDSGFKPSDKLERTDTIISYLGVLALSEALLFLSYFTYAHESTSRYPLEQRGDISKGQIGCDDYNNSLGMLSIVDRIGKIGYITSITLNDMKDGIDSIALFFAARPKQ